ncbi:MAG TPA: response regulator [Pirellulales bacterium]|nr:response regulator [Pirellulales bacterium]
MAERHRILLVDDNQELVQAAALRLRAAGYETLRAYDGQQCIVSAVSHRPDAILLDVQMPIKDGLTTLAELQASAETRAIPIVMLSASIVDEQAALQTGARYFLKKPCESQHLLRALATVMRN